MKLSEIAEQNTHWKVPTYALEAQDLHLRRAREEAVQFTRPELRPELGQVYVILGPRQVGKTTYLKQTILRLLARGSPPTPGHYPARQLLFLSCDRFRSSEEFRRAIRQFVAQNQGTSGGVLFLDEITALSNWPIELKRLADQGIPQRFPVVATGSSSHELRRQSEQLPGRGLEGNSRVMRPFTFRGFLQWTLPLYRQGTSDDGFRAALEELGTQLEGASAEAPDEVAKAAQPLFPFVSELDHLLRHYLVLGGYPRAISAAFSEVTKQAGAVFPMVERPPIGLEGSLPKVDDRFAEVLVRHVLGDAGRAPRNEVIARHLLRALLDREGQRGSYNMLAREVGVNHSTAIEYLAALDGAYIAMTLEAHDPRSGRPKPRSDKKFHLCDPFLRIAVDAHLRGIAPAVVAQEKAENEDELGRLVESLVAVHLAANGEVPYRRDRQAFLGFAYDASKREVDALVHLADGSRLGVEVKYQSDVRPGNIARLEGLERYLVLSRDDLDLDDPSAPVVPAAVALAALRTSPAHL